VTPAGCCNSAESTARGELGLCHNVATDTSTYATPVRGTAVADDDAVADADRNFDGDTVANADAGFDGCTVAEAVLDCDEVLDRNAVADGAADATDGVADGAVGTTNSADRTAANDCDEAGDVCDTPDELDDLALLEQPASIPSTARLTPAHRRPRIFLL